MEAPSITSSPQPPKFSLIIPLWAMTAWILFSCRSSMGSRNFHLNLFSLGLGPFFALIDYSIYRLFQARPHSGYRQRLRSWLEFRLDLWPAAEETTTEQEKSQAQALAEKDGVMTAIFRSKKLGFFTLYLRLPSHTPWLLSTFWSVAFFCAVLLHSAKLTWFSENLAIKSVLSSFQVLLSIITSLNLLDLAAHLVARARNM